MARKPSALLGKKVWIRTDIDSPYAGEWGIVKFFFAGAYEIAIWGGEESREFYRNEFKVPKQ